MKRQLHMLTYDDHREIRNWLRLSKIKRKGQCPFKLSCFKCEWIFPTLKIIDGIILCPCSQFTVRYVTKVARQILKEQYVNRGLVYSPVMLENEKGEYMKVKEVELFLDEVKDVLMEMANVIRKI